MKLIIERDATFENMEVKVKHKKLSRAFEKGNKMKKDMLNSQIHLTSQSTEGESPLEVNVHA